MFHAKLLPFLTSPKTPYTWPIFLDVDGGIFAGNEHDAVDPRIDGLFSPLLLSGFESLLRPLVDAAHGNEDAANETQERFG